ADAARRPRAGRRGEGDQERPDHARVPAHSQAAQALRRRPHEAPRGEAEGKEVMALKVPYLADVKLESAATELLRKYAKWKGTPPRPPIPIDDIVEGLLGLSLSIGDLRARLGKDDVLGATWLEDGHVMIDSSLEGNEGRFCFTL